MKSLFQNYNFDLLELSLCNITNVFDDLNHSSVTNIYIYIYISGRGQKLFYTTNISFFFY